METRAKLGDVVIYTDSRGIDHMAVVTCVWTDLCINVCFVSMDETRHDSYGRQIERETSVQHVSIADVHGRYYRLIGQEKRGYTPPQAT